MTIDQKLEHYSVPVTESGCSIWTGATTSRGYGSMWISGKAQSAHRMAWEVLHGRITGGLHVCHRCDVPLCVNGEHLFLGTARENLRDATLKGRNNTPLHRAAIVAACKGKKVWLGRTHSEITKAKISAALRKRHIDRIDRGDRR